MSTEELDTLKGVVVAVDDLIQVNKQAYLDIIRNLEHGNIKSKQVVGLIHLLLKHPILELVKEQPLGADQ
jgi:hypothetical protein